jgi:hypothetical protein
MKLGDICSTPCFTSAAQFDIPPPGCNRRQLQFEHDGRDYYAVLLRNHDVASAAKLNPRLAVVGLSPAGNQIDEFVDVYGATRDYFAASVAGAFAGLARDIIAMIKGLGIANKLGLHFPNPSSLTRHPDIYVTSLVACASLKPDGSSDDFDPKLYEGARRCMTERFVGEMLNPAFSRLSHVLILGSKGWSAIQTTRSSANKTIIEVLRSRGKIVLNLPHPSGQNQEYVKLASLSAEQTPSLDSYVSQRWAEYSEKPARLGRGKEPKDKYMAKRTIVWSTIDKLRRDIARLDVSQ